MKKAGFTLAEVLITLGIVGVVAALAIPTFVQKTQTAQIGPKLAKAVAAYEHATKALLTDANKELLNSVKGCIKVDSSNADFCKEKSNVLMIEDAELFATNLGFYMSGTPINRDEFLSSDGVKYYITIKEPHTPAANDSDSPKDVPLSDTQSSSLFIIDINGVKGPNINGKDWFYFTAWGDGSLRPVGAAGWSGTYDPNETWQKKCPLSQNTSSSGEYDVEYCAGHIFENGLKADYSIK